MLDAVCNWAKYNILSKRRSSIRWRVFRYLSSTSQRENVKNLFFWNFDLQLQPHNSQRIEIDPKQKLRANVCMPCLLTTYEIFGKYLRKVFKYLRICILHLLLRIDRLHRNYLVSLIIVPLNLSPNNKWSKIEY